MHIGHSKKKLRMNVEKRHRDLKKPWKIDEDADMLKI